jgi:pilus assembly protein CpaE
MPIICEPDENAARRLGAGFREHGRVVAGTEELSRALAAHPEELVVVMGPGADLRTALGFAAVQRVERPALGVVLVRTQLEVDVLADAMRAGVREVVPDRDFPALMDACRRSWEISARMRSAEQIQAGARAQPPPGRKGRVVVVFAGKGGCGKSMVSTNLAVSLARNGRLSVCILDLDLGFGDVGIMLRVNPQRTIVDAVSMAEHMDETGVQSMLASHESGVSAVLAPVTPGDAEKISGKLVTELLAVLRRMFDVVVVDTPPQFSEQVLASLDVADIHVLIATPEVTALKGLRVTLDMLDLLGYAADSRTIVLNRADARAGLSAADINRVIGRPIAAHIPTSQDVSASINRGVPLALENAQHPVSQAITELGRVLLDDSTSRPGATSVQRKSGFRRSRAGRS